MKLLALNLGNTSLFAGVFTGERLVRSWRVPAARLTGPKAFAALVAARAGGVDRVVLCSVVPAQTGRLVRWIRQTLRQEPDVLSATAEHGLRIGYRRPRELGADRVAAALGAHKLFPRRNVIIVDCGTATTVTALRREGVILGGAILPGLGLWPAMLAARTAQLPAVPLRVPARSVGRSTREALQSGLLFGHAGAIRELVVRTRREAFGRAPAVVVGTGGWAPYFRGQTLFTVTEPGLILHGLQAYSPAKSAHA